MYVLNFKSNVVGSLLVLGSIFALIFISARAFGGSSARKLRAVFAVRVKGLNLVFTSVKKRVIIVNGDCGARWRRIADGGREMEGTARKQ